MLVQRNRLILNKLFAINSSLQNFKVPEKWVSYIQGQEPKPKIREYFYFIDHQGMLFLDDSRMKNFTSCFKDKKFLKFFFDRLRINDTERYKDDFPYLSICGRERNFVRCDDYPFVFTHVFEKSAKDGNVVDHFCYAHAGDVLSLLFEPKRIFMSPTSGRVYHPAPEKVGGIGLVRSNLAIEFSKLFKFEGDDTKPPTHFSWKGETHLLDTTWYKEAVVKNRENNIFVRDDLVEKELL